MANVALVEAYGDPGRPGSVSDPLLEGEDPTTEDSRDARTWIAVYQELIALGARTLERRQNPALRLRQGSTSPNGELGPVTSHLQRYHRRIAFWQQRHFELAGMVLDSGSRTLARDGASVRLTSREFDLFRALAATPDQYLTARQLVLHAWGDSNLSDEELRIYIGTLRRKLRAIGGGEIVNRWGRGYVLRLRATSDDGASLDGADGVNAWRGTKQLRALAAEGRSASDQLQPLVAPQL
ncbi:MAG: winged helix-turn-helix transcriptional regulator [Candidatus Dormibacteraeota bacterium]|nr:winged helix-turn-helix transcriptional regulator [Candidatus Dormibacteraeota bacterium]